MHVIYSSVKLIYSIVGVAESAAVITAPPRTNCIEISPLTTPLSPEPDMNRYTDFDPSSTNTLGRPNSDLVDYYDDGHIPAVRPHFHSFTPLSPKH